MIYTELKKIPHEVALNQAKEITNELINLLQEKAKAYSPHYDFLDTFKDFGILGITVRLGDKYKRLKNIVLNNIETEETIEDTLKDMANYCIIGLIYYRNIIGKKQ